MQRQQRLGKLGQPPDRLALLPDKHPMPLLPPLVKLAPPPNKCALTLQVSPLPQQMPSGKLELLPTALA
jgi:hypothetical protein